MHDTTTSYYYVYKAVGCVLPFLLTVGRESSIVGFELMIEIKQKKGGGKGGSWHR